MPFQAATATPRRAMTPAAFVRGVVAAYALYGRDPAEALGKGQVTEDLVRSQDGRVTAAQFEALAGHAMRELDDEALGWFSRRLPWGTYGMLCRASITAPNLEVALKRWCRHHRLLTEDVLFELSLGDETATISLREQRDLGHLREFCLVTLLRYVLGFSCWAVDSAIALRAAEFPYAEPGHVSVYPTIFCRHLSFDANGARIAFDNCVRCRLSISRTRCSIMMLCCSGVFTGTNRIVGRATASQIASASAASFLPRLT